MPVVTPARRAFVARLGLAFEPTELPAYGVGAFLLAIAHGAFESGWGASRPARLGRNFWNLTRAPSDLRPIVESGDRECDDAGVCRPIRQRFRAYAADHEAAADYLAFLARPRYALALGALYAGNAAEFARALRQDDPTTPQPEGGFYTAPLAEYALGLVAALAAVRRAYVDAAAAGEMGAAA